jgi:hypothetical protein
MGIDGQPRGAPSQRVGLHAIPDGSGGDSNTVEAGGPPPGGQAGNRPRLARRQMQGLEQERLNCLSRYSHRRASTTGGSGRVTSNHRAGATDPEGGLWGEGFVEQPVPRQCRVPEPAECGRSAMDRGRLVAAMSAARLAPGVAGTVMALRRVHPYDVVWMHDQRSRETPCSRAPPCLPRCPCCSHSGCLDRGHSLPAQQARRPGLRDLRPCLIGQFSTSDHAPPGWPRTRPAKATRTRQTRPGHPFRSMPSQA